MVALLLFCGAACARRVPETAGPIPQRGYLWQREWKPEVAAGFAEAARHFSGVIPLAAEVEVQPSGLRTARARIDWPIVKGSGLPGAIAIRVGPASARVEAGSSAERGLHELIRSILEEAQKAGAVVGEVQLDFDAPQKGLAVYRAWLTRLRPVVGQRRLVITTLPAWLAEPEFARLIAEADGYVLQVHSVPVRGAGGREVLCDPAQAQAWVARAAQLGRPFSVALPTYWCVAGYAPDGRLLGIWMDGSAPAWPRETHTFELHAEADQLAGLVAQWQRARPELLREIIWFRVPVTSDQRNWRWPTLAAVMQGRTPLHRLEPRISSSNPVEVEVANAGEADEVLSSGVAVKCFSDVVASDGLDGWSVEAAREGVIFTPAPNRAQRLAPGEKKRIGWVRLKEDGEKVEAQMHQPR